MKKIISLLLALSMLFLLCACGTSEPADPATILHSHEWWTSTADSRMNITFYDGGTGMMTISDNGAYTYHWSFIDSDTIKITIDLNASQITLDIVDNKGDHQLVNAKTGVVTYVPYK